jgi:hypothetical protein
MGNKLYNTRQIVTKLTTLDLIELKTLLSWVEKRHVSLLILYRRVAITQGRGSSARQHSKNRHQALDPRPHRAEDTPQLGGEETREPVDPLS